MDLQQLSKEITTPWGSIGYIVFKRTYARRVKDDDPSSKTEEFWQVVQREIDSFRKQLKVGFTPEEELQYAKYRLALKFSTAGRFMWQLGTKTVDKLGLPSLQNCSFVTVNTPIRPFTWAFEMLMLGSGVGFNIQKENVYQLPKLLGKIKIERKDSNDADYIVPDTREGWVKLLGKVLKAHYYSEKGFTYSTVCVRGKGAPIKGFGGTASGPEELCWGINEVHRILNSRANKKLRPIDCLDIMNIIGFIVVSGNVRRSAQIAIGDYDDLDFLKSKRWDLGSIPNWRSMSNNSIYAPKDLNSLPQEFWDTFIQGEPFGLVNLELAKSCGRVGETQYQDVDIEGVNPCSEQWLNNFETCCLSEVYLPNISSLEELNDAIKYSYRINKHSLTLPCSLKETEDIVHKNMRMGIGMTGILEATEEQRSWLDIAYRELRKYDEYYSDLKGFPRSIKLTTIKPSGTLSLLAGVTPGIHPSPAGPYYYRRMRISSDSALIKVCKNHGYDVEPAIEFDGSNSKTTMVVTFPCKVGENVPIESDYTYTEQLDMVRRMQREWSDNAISCTIYYKKKDLEGIKEYLNKHFLNEIKGVSFLLSQEHGFKQAPYETISKETYEKAISKVTPITNIDVNENDFDLVDCSGGACPIK